MLFKLKTNNSFIFLALIFSVCAETSEKNINSKWCDEIKGYSEFRTKYGTYVDCLTDIYAVEAEYDYNWKEAIGQSLHYSEATKKLPAILFIKRLESKKNYLYELQETINHHELNIKIFVIDEQGIIVEE
jgi:hypothetical protein